MGTAFVNIEWINENVGIIRGGYNWQFGSPFDFVATIVCINGRWEIKGLLGKFNKDFRIELARVLKSNGIEKVYYERINKINKRRVEKSN